MVTATKHLSWSCCPQGWDREGQGTLGLELVVVVAAAVAVVVLLATAVEAVVVEAVAAEVEAAVVVVAAGLFGAVDLPS